MFRVLLGFLFPIFGVSTFQVKLIENFTRVISLMNMSSEMFGDINLLNDSCREEKNEVKSEVGEMKDFTCDVER